MQAPAAGPPTDADPPAFDRFARRTGETIAGFAVATAANGLYLLLLARTLGPSGTGVVTVSIVVASALTYVVAITFIIANLFFGAREPASRGALLGNSLAVSFGVAGPLAALSFGVLEAASLTFGGSSAELAVALASVPFFAGSRILHALIVASGRSRAFNVLSALPAVLSLAFIGAAFAVFSPSVLLALVGYSASQVVVFAASLASARIRPARPSRTLLAASLRYGLRGSPGHVIQLFNFRLDLFLVSSLKGPAAAGIYSVAVYLAELLWKIPAAAGTLLFPRVASARNAPVEFTMRVARTILLVTAASGAALAVLAYVAVLPALGGDFHDAIRPLVLLLPGVVAIALANILASDLAARGTPEFVTYGALVALAVTIALAPLLIRSYGPEGAATASSVAYTVSAIFLAAIFVRRFRIAPSGLLLLRREDFAVARRRHAGS